nr:hypothetical protein [Tanacetum cinerariifolium]
MALPPRDQRHQYLRFEDTVLDLDTAGALHFQLGGVRRRMSRREFILALGLHTTEEMQTTGFGLYWVESARQILYKGDLSAYWIVISIVGRSQATEKVIVTDLFYLRGMDVESVNVPYLLGRYLRLFASGRKQGAMISGDLHVIDMAELVRLQLCIDLDDTWAWVAPGLERQPDATAGAPEATEDAPIADEGAPAIPAPVQASQPPPPIVELAQTMAQRFARVEEDMNEIRRALGE